MVLVVLLILLLVAAAVALAVYDTRSDARRTAADRSVAVAVSVADSPTVVTALSSPDPSAPLQPFAERVRADTGVDFVVVMALDRTRYTHPRLDRIGQSFVGDLGDAPSGEIFTQEYVGTLGPSVRAVVPVVDDDGKVAALVSVGITLDAINQQLTRDLTAIALAAAASLAIGAAGTGWISRRLRRATHGLGEREIGRIYEYHQAVLHAVREGLLLVDREGVVVLANDEARRLLGLPDDVTGRHLASLGLPPALVSATQTQTQERDDIYTAGEFVLVVSSSPADWRGRGVGSVVTLRDHTELQEVLGELDVVRGLTESLRSQQHEAANRLHTVVSLIETGRAQEAVEFATGELHVAQLLTDRIIASVGDPVLGALLLAKLAEAAEIGVDLKVRGAFPEGVAISARDLVTIVGNLLDNAFDAVAEQPSQTVLCELGGHEDELRVSVADSGPGAGERDIGQLLDRGWTTKAVTDSRPGASRRGIGLALVAQAVRRHRGRISVDASSLGGADFVVTLPVLLPVRVPS